MQINHIETMERCKIINRNELARQCGVSAPVALHVIRGDYPYMQSPGAKRVIAKLDELHLLVKASDSHDSSLAA